MLGRMDLILTIGIAGALLILVAFIGDQIGKLSAKSFFYDVINFFGSGLLIVYGTLIAAWPFVVLNTIWFLVSLRDVIQHLVQKPKNR
jgi:hypothetical protein